MTAADLKGYSHLVRVPDLGNHIIGHYEKHAVAWDRDRQSNYWHDKTWHDRFINRVAYELVRAAFGYRGVKIDEDTIADKVIANRIIQLAKAGERNPDLLCEETFNSFQQHS